MHVHFKRRTSRGRDYPAEVCRAHYAGGAVHRDSAASVGTDPLPPRCSLPPTGCRPSARSRSAQYSMPSRMPKARSERLCGATLYHEAWYRLSTQSRSLGDRFKNAMNDAFEVFVGGILHRIALKGKGIQNIVDEAEMQAAWTEQKDKTPSVCDWMLLGEGHCVSWLTVAKR